MTPSHFRLGFSGFLRARPTAAALIVPAFLLALSGCAGADGVNRRTGPRYVAETQSWVQSTQKLAANGMWLVTRGYHRGDDVVAVATNSPLSHASIVDMDELSVIEAVGTGVRVTPLPRFLREAHRVLIIKPRGWTADKGREAVRKARAQVGKGYDFLGVIGAPDEQRWYCSELAAWSIGIEVNQTGPQHVLHPRNMHELGEVLFDSGARDGRPDAPPRPTAH